MRRATRPRPTGHTALSGARLDAVNHPQRTLLRTAAAGVATLLALAAAGACAADDPVAPPASSSSTVAPETNDTEGTTVGTTEGTTRGTTGGTTPGTTGGTAPEGDEDEDASATPTSVNADHTDWCDDFRAGLTEIGALPDETEEEAAAAAGLVTVMAGAPCPRT